MMRNTLAFLCCIFISALFLLSCASQNKPVKIGVSLGGKSAERWNKEKIFMEDRARELGVSIDVRLNREGASKAQVDDCIELINSGIDVLILMPRDVNQAEPIIAYAKSKKVPVVNYARVILGSKVDLFVGYDSLRIGQRMGLFISEKAYKGYYIILRGDPGDNNAELLYEGAMRYIDPIKKDINIILDAAVESWSPDIAKKMVKEAVASNGKRIDAIFAPNDKIAGAAAEALEELGIKKHVSITGMDTELEAIRRIVAGKQDMTIYLDLKNLASIAVEEAVHIARKEKVNINSEYNNYNGDLINANLISGQIITRENLDKKLIESGYFTKEDAYGK